MIDQLAELLEQGRPVPLSGLRVINADEFAQLLERMRINVPSSIRESERTLAERDAILAEAHGEAERILAEAQEQAREMLSRESLMLAAQHEADRIVDESRASASRRIEEADRYATKVLEDLAQKLAVISQQVNNGILLLQADETLGTPQAEPEQSADDAPSV